METLEAILKSKDIEFLDGIQKRVYSRLQDLRDVVAMQKKLEFSVGEKVEWAGKYGHIKGTIEKICSKNILVRRTDNERRECWRVHPSFLRKQGAS